jgi:alpha-glucosidase (family GH31 glycosyl hydrolase)
MLWRFDGDVEEYGITALKLHAELLPLFYSLDYRNHTEGIQPVRPMYDLAPLEEEL